MLKGVDVAPRGRQVAVLCQARAVWAIAVLVAMILPAACAKSFPSSEISPGSKYYPVENRSKRHFLAIIATIPATLNLKLRAVYRVSPSAKLSCQRTVGLSVTAPYTVSAPIALGLEGDHYRGSVAVDRFQPGTCGWSFVGVAYYLARAWPNEGGLVRYENRVARPGEAARRVDVWCIADLRAPNPTYPERCMGWSMLARAASGWVDSKFTSSISFADRSSSDSTTATSDTKSVELHFHDVDELRSAAGTQDH